MSRRSLQRRDKLGYDSALGVKGEAKGYHTSQCGGQREKYAALERGKPRSRPRCAECGRHIRGKQHVEARPGQHPREMQRRAELQSGGSGRSAPASGNAVGSPGERKEP